MSSETIDTLIPIKNLTWQALPGFPGIEVINLSGHLDETLRAGRRTRLVRFKPGIKTSQPLVHDYHEEAFLVSGDIQGFDQAQGFGFFSEPAYVHRPPGTPHGPMKSEHGCILLEIHYYET